MRGSRRHAKAELTQRGDVIQDPKRPAVGSDDYIVFVNYQVADRRGRKIQLERLPMIAIVPRDIDAAFGSGKKQSLAHGIFAHGVDGLVLRQAGDDLLPRLSAVVRTIDIRMQV